MKKNYKILGLVCVLLLLAAYWGGLFDNGPTFHGRTAQRWSHDLRYQKSNAETVEAFQKMGTISIPFLLAEIHEEESRFRKFRRSAWNKLPSTVQQRFPLATSLDIGSHQVAVVNILRDMGPASITPVLYALRTGRPEVRATCAWAVGGFKTNAPLIVPQLVKAMSDKDAEVRRHAAGSLGEFGRESSAAVPILISTLLNDSDAGTNGRKVFVRDAAIRALGKIGPQARDAVPVLKQLLQDNNTRLVVFSAIALWKIEGDASISLPVLTNQYAAWNDYEKWTILRTFGDMGTNAIAVVPILHDHLKVIAGRTGFPGDEIRRDALEAIRKIDPVAATNIANELHLKLEPMNK